MATADTDDAPAAPVAAPVEFAEDVTGDLGDPAVDALLARARTEYGRFTARASLTFGGTLAFTAGTPVPAHHSHVTACPATCGCGLGGWLDAGLLDDAEPGEPIPAEPR